MDFTQHHYHALVVEDTMEIAANTIEMLNFIGLQTTHAQNADEAMAFLQDNRPDLILLDLHLPGVNGWEVLKYAKTKYGKMGLTVIVTTAMSDPTNRMIGRLEYVDRYLVKPFTHKELHQAIRETLDLDQSFS